MSPKKQNVIDKILSNRSWLPSGAVYETTAKALARLSLLNLNYLLIIIEAKVTEATDCCGACGEHYTKSGLCPECTEFGDSL